MVQQIIIPKRGFKKETYPFLEIVKSPAKALEVVNHICAELAHSFKVDEKRMGKSFREKIQTQAEVERRTDILCDWFRTLRCECSYSTDRALAVLGTALRTELDGGTFEPPKAEGMFSPATQGEA